jgi:hypothetical protein
VCPMLSLFLDFPFLIAPSVLIPLPILFCDIVEI